MDTIIIGGVEFPEKCPKKCPGKEGPFYQGNLCSRCPIFNCTTEYKLMEPKEYRKDWASDFKKWFDSDFNNDYYPQLKF
jgi:hypothetical protein